jgi:hypothetical protein
VFQVFRSSERKKHGFTKGILLALMKIIKCYQALEEANQIYLVTVYGKDQKDDLSAEDKKLFRQFTRVLKD